MVQADGALAIILIHEGKGEIATLVIVINPLPD